MDRQAIKAAITTLQARGEEPSAGKIRKLLVEQHGQGPNYRDIYAVMRKARQHILGHHHCW
jgi:hypothetical protein